MTGKWRGEYTYGEGYFKEIQGRSVVFKLDMTYADGDITGTCADEEADKLFNQPATFTGFIDNDVISFIKKYPCFWTIDEKGNTQRHEDIPSSEIHYYGNFIGGKFSGDWELYYQLMNEQQESHGVYCFGTWSMQKD